VKSRLKALLLNSLFVLDLRTAGFTEYSITYFDVLRANFWVRVLGLLGARELSASLARQGLAKAKTVEEWSLALDFLATLRARASQDGDPKAYEVYANEHAHYQKLLAAEYEAMMAQERIKILFARKKSERPEDAAATDSAARRVSALAAEFPSFKLSFLALRLQNTASELRMDYASTLRICDEAFALLNRYPIFATQSRFAEYAFARLLAAVQLHNTEAAQKAIEECNIYLSDRAGNWFVFKEWVFLFLMQRGRFTEGHDLVNAVVSHPRYSTLTELARQNWEFFRLCAEYATGRRVQPKSIEALNRLLPVLAGDKAGLNTAMILLNLLLLVERDRFAELRDRTEYIKGYRKRFLKGPANSHASHFFAMLGLLETCDLNFKKIDHRADAMVKELERMETMEPIQGELVFTYRWMWNRIMDGLRRYHPLAHR